jgi:hypothetical protein
MIVARKAEGTGTDADNHPASHRNITWYPYCGASDIEIQEMIARPGDSPFEDVLKPCNGCSLAPCRA